MGGFAPLRLLLMRLRRARLLLGGHGRFCCRQDGLWAERRWFSGGVAAPQHLHLHRERPS